MTKSEVNKKIAKKYLNKFFPFQCIDERDHEFKSLVRILNKKDKGSTCQCNFPVKIKEEDSKSTYCGKCGKD